jgi:hypothetical protein
MAVHFLNDIKAEGRAYAELRERIKEAFALADDDQALADTLDGASDFPDFCVAALREAKAIEAMAEGLAALVKDMQTRKARLEHSAERLRALVAGAMMEAGERKFTAPDMTITVRDGKPKPTVRDEARLPDRYKMAVTTIKPNMDAIRDAIAHGDVPEGVEISNGGPVLTVRIK